MSEGAKPSWDFSGLFTLTPVVTPFRYVFLPPEWRRQFHTVRTPKPAEFLTAREEFREAWETLTALGIESGFLEQGDEGDMWVTDHTEDVETVWDENEEEHEERLKLMPNDVGLRGRTDLNVLRGTAFMRTEI